MALASRTAGERMRAAAVALTMILLFQVVFTTAAGAVQDEPETYLLRHVATDQFLASDGWGPSTLASTYDGPLAQWHRIAGPDRTVEFRNRISGLSLAHTGGSNGHEVGVTGEPSADSGWTETSSDGFTEISINNAFLVADGKTVRSSVNSGPDGQWELIEVEPTAPRFVTLTNEATAQQLASSIALDGTVITSDFGGITPASSRWELIEVVTTSRRCERHPSWQSAPYGNTSRVTTCHILRNRANGEYLDSNSSDNSNLVTTAASIGLDGYWNLSDIASGVSITLENAEFGRYLADDGSEGTTDASVTSTSRWTLEDVDPGCKPLRSVQIDSHRSGELVDTSAAGTATGSFLLFGTAPPNVSSIEITTRDESGVLTIGIADDCETQWSIEVAGARTETVEFTVTATGPFGVSAQAVSLDIIAPSEADTLLQPTFTETPQFHDRLLAYDPDTGTLVFSGDISNEIAPGDGLGGDISPLAPAGYLRIVQVATFDGTNTAVRTRQAGLTEFVRRLDIDYQSPDPTTPVEPSLLRSFDEPESTPQPGPIEPEIVVGDGMRSVEQTPAPAAQSPASVIPDSTAERSALAQSNPIGDSGPLGPDTDLNLEFSIDPNADVDLDISIDWRSFCFICIPIPVPDVREFGFEVGLDFSAEVELVHRAESLFEKSENFGPEFDDFRFATVTIPTPAIVPVVITFEADSQAFYEIAVDAVMRVQYQLGFEVSAGFEYKGDGTGRGGFSNAEFTGGAPSLDFDAGILASAAVGLEIDIEGLLYGQAGIEVEATPQLQLEAIGDLVDKEVAWELKIVVPFAAGVDIEIELGPVGWEGEFGELSIAEISFVLFNGTFFSADDTTLVVEQTGPPGVFPSQRFSFNVAVTNTGDADAESVSVDFVLPSVGSFVSSSPPGNPSAPSSGDNYSIVIGDVGKGETELVTIRWDAPDLEGVTMTSTATATAENLDAAANTVSTSVTTGIEGRCNPCGAAAGGTGLRNRSQGTIEIAGLPPGATVTRAVLVWGVLYRGSTPANSITFAGTPVTADVSATISGNLCWGDAATIGYAADVTGLVDGNGSYVVSDPPRGITRVDSNPAGVLPYTDGASLVVFYVGGGANSQIISDFTYNTNTDPSGTIQRSFIGVNSVGSNASLTLAGPDGQNNAGESFTVTGAGSTTLVDTWDGSDAQDGPSFAIGNLWDTDTYDVTSILPAGQSTLSLSYRSGNDCIGVAASVLEISQD